MGQGGAVLLLLLWLLLQRLGLAEGRVRAAVLPLLALPLLTLLSLPLLPLSLSLLPLAEAPEETAVHRQRWEAPRRRLLLLLLWREWRRLLREGRCSCCPRCSRGVFGGRRESPLPQALLLVVARPLALAPLLLLLERVRGSCRRAAKAVARIPPSPRRSPRRSPRPSSKPRARARARVGRLPPAWGGGRQRRAAERVGRRGGRGGGRGRAEGVGRVLLLLLLLLVLLLLRVLLLLLAGVRRGLGVASLGVPVLEERLELAEQPRAWALALLVLLLLVLLVLLQR